MTAARKGESGRENVNSRCRPGQENGNGGGLKGLGFKHQASGVELLKKGLYSPIINIDGLTAGYSGAGTKTVLPRVASAKVDIRFGPNMEPAEVIDKFKRHLVRRGFEDIEVMVRDNYTWSKTCSAARPRPGNTCA